MLWSRDAHVTDPVTMSRVIATALLEDLRDTSRTQVERLSVANLLRLLEMYASGNFYARRPLGILERDNFAGFTGAGTAKRYIKLQSAIKEAHDAVAPELDPPTFVVQIGNILAALQDHQKPSEQERKRLDEFLSHLTQSLAKP